MASHGSFIKNYEFTVMLDGFSFGFSKINNISASAEFDTILNGGHNSSPVILPKPKRQPDMLVMEHGTQTSIKDMMFSMIHEGNMIASVMIFVKRNGKVCRIFSASNALIVSREFSTLDAFGDEVFVESLQLAHEGLTEIALPLAVDLSFIV